MSGVLFNPPRFVPVSNAGVPLASAKLYVYQAGTSTAVDTFTTSALSQAAKHTSPIVADSAGVFAAIFLDPTTGYDYKFVLNTSADVLVWSQDNVSVAVSGAKWGGTAGGTADAITLTPTVPVSAYYVGQTIRFLSGSANTGAVTIAVSGLAAKSVTKNGTTALAAADIPAGAIITITYDGTRFQMQGDAITAAHLLALLLTVDGAGSGIDADFLDGASSAAYATLAGNQTFTGANTVADLIHKIERGVMINVASGTDIAWQTTGSTWRITGTTTINTIATPTTGGTRITLLFSESVTVNDDSTSSGNLVLAGGSNLSATANDVLQLLWDSNTSKWVEVGRSVN